MRAIVGFLIEAHGTKCEETLLNSSRPSGSDPCSNAPLRSFGQTPGPKRWLLDLRSVADVHAEQWPLWGMGCPVALAQAWSGVHWIAGLRPLVRIDAVVLVPAVAHDADR